MRRSSSSLASSIGAGVRGAAVALLLVAAVSCGGGSGDPTETAQPADTAPVLQPDEINAIMQLASRATDQQIAVAVTDRQARILGVATNFPVDRNACKAAACQDDAQQCGAPVCSTVSSDCASVDLSVQLARTAGLFSADQIFLTSRAVRFISDPNFPPGVRNTGAGGLFSIEATNRGCRLDANNPLSADFNPGKFYPPQLNLASFLREQDGEEPRRSPLRAWTEPRTLLLGLFVFCMAFTEGTGVDWLGVAVIDGYDAAPALGSLTFAVFLAAMTLGRWFGPQVIDRLGRVTTVRASALVALVGLLLVVFGGVLPLAVVGSALWGLGAALGFPVGMSAAADDPRHAAGRVSVVSSIGYLAFLAGPPLIGFLGHEVGTLRALTAAAGAVTLGLLVSGVLRPPATALGGDDRHGGAPGVADQDAAFDLVGRADARANVGDVGGRR